MSQVCEYCGQEERYGHNAICVMNTVVEQRTQIKRLCALLSEIDSLWTAMPEIAPKGNVREKVRAALESLTNEQTSD